MSSSVIAILAHSPSKRMFEKAASGIGIDSALYANNNTLQDDETADAMDIDANPSEIIKPQESSTSSPSSTDLEKSLQQLYLNMHRAVTVLTQTDEESNNKTTDTNKNSDEEKQKASKFIITACSQFISSLPDPLQDYATQAVGKSTTTPTKSDNSDNTTNNVTLKVLLPPPSPTVRLDTFEINVRSHLLSITQELLDASANNDEAVVEESMEDLLMYMRSVTDFVWFLLVLATYCRKLFPDGFGALLDDTCDSTQVDGESAQAEESSNQTDTKDQLDSTNTLPKQDPVTRSAITSAFKCLDQYRGMDLPLLRKLPFMLLEDLVDSLPIPIIQLFWKYGPSTWFQCLLCSCPMLPSLPSSTTKTNQNDSSKTTPSTSSIRGEWDIFNQGSKYCVIRFCNKLLRNISVHGQTSAAEFAGQISLILASVFPLSERSAVNVLGAFHVDNEVVYETKDEWSKNCSISTTTTTTTANKSIKDHDYDFYQTFWGLQKCFTNPVKLLPTISVPAAAGTNQLQQLQQKKLLLQQQQKQQNGPWRQEINRFISSVGTVLGAFEAKPLSSELIKSWKESKKQNDTADTPDETQGGSLSSSKNNASVDINKREYKYLTNSQLLNLQLQDPELRLQVLTQLLIITSYLSVSISSSLFFGSPSSNTITTLSNTLLTNLSTIDKRASELMRQIPPNGEIHLKNMQWILSDRESIWKQWKKSKCNPPIEKYSGQKITPAMKRRRATTSSDISSKIKLFSYKIDVKNDLPKMSQKMKETHLPQLDKFLEDYVEALDPEAGIEDEYHPRNDKLFVWRAMRLLSHKYVGSFGQNKDKAKEASDVMIRKRTGDFEGLVRKIWKDEKGIVIPGAMEAEEESDDEKKDEDSKEDSKDDNEEKKDAGDGDDASKTVNGNDDSGSKDNGEKDIVMEESKDDKEDTSKKHEVLPNSESEKNMTSPNAVKDAVRIESKSNNEPTAENKDKAQSEKFIPDASKDNSITAQEENDTKVKLKIGTKEGIKKENDVEQNENSKNDDRSNQDEHKSTQDTQISEGNEASHKRKREDAEAGDSNQPSTQEKQISEENIVSFKRKREDDVVNGSKKQSKIENSDSKNNRREGEMRTVLGNNKQSGSIYANPPVDQKKGANSERNLNKDLNTSKDGKQERSRSGYSQDQYHHQPSEDSRQNGTHTIHSQPSRNDRNDRVDDRRRADNGRSRGSSRGSPHAAAPAPPPPPPPPPPPRNSGPSSSNATLDRRSDQGYTRRDTTSSSIRSGGRDREQDDRGSSNRDKRDRDTLDRRSSEQGYSRSRGSSTNSDNRGGRDRDRDRDERGSSNRDKRDNRDRHENSRRSNRRHGSRNHRRS